ncbi:MAG TPA: NADH-quinone oxidoreductase subunit J [Burkholderiaceae bacterium]
MEVKTALFYVFATLTVLSALRVVTARNPVHAALFLVLSFVSAACIWMLLQAEFLAIVLVLVYVGAVMVLFLFVVMMLDINLDQMRKGFWRNLPVAAFVGVVVVLELAAVIMHVFSGVKGSDAPVQPAGYSNTKALGKLLYTDYVFPFEVAGVILLVAMVAAIALTLRRRKDVRYTDPAEAVRTRSTDRVRLVSMPAQPRDEPK